MGLANDSIPVTPGSGATVATQIVNAKEHQVVMPADDTGHILGTAPTYRLYVPAQAAGANKVYFDLFNATGSGQTLRVKSVEAIKDGSVAVTGALSVKLYLTRTSAVGTGGTAATSQGTSLTAITFSKHNPNDSALPAGVTARSSPTGGATAGAILSERHIFPEETNASNYDKENQFCNPLHAPILVTENTGLRVVQGAVASVGNIGFAVIFEAV
jgi:hypothetical protein